MSGTLLKLLVKDKLPHGREVPVNAKEWQLKIPRREIADEHQPARKVGS